MRSDGNDTHPSDVSAENIGGDSAAADKDEKPQSRSNSFHLRDTLEEQVCNLPSHSHCLHFKSLSMLFLITSSPILDLAVCKCQ